MHRLLLGFVLAPALTAVLWLVVYTLFSVLFNPYAHMAVSARGASAILDSVATLASQLHWPLFGAVLLLVLVFVVLRAVGRNALRWYVLSYAVIAPALLSPIVVLMSNSMGPEKGLAIVANYLGLVLFMTPVPFVFWWLARPQSSSSNSALQPTHEARG